MNRKGTAVVFAGILLLSGPALAQETAPEPNESTAEDAAGQESTPAARADAREQDADPFDYEASEQISEDLSVSFPVDI